MRSALPQRPKVRAGLTTAERATLGAMAKEVVRLRAGATPIREREGSRTVVRWWGQCQWCTLILRAAAPSGWLQWAHIHSRGAAPHMVWDTDNAWAGCAKHHLFGWHKDPNLAERFIAELIGPVRRRQLEVRALVRPAQRYRPSFREVQMLILEARRRVLSGTEVRA